MTSVKRLSAILYDLDPVRLRSMGAPSDEYDGEAEDIYPSLTLSACIEDIHDLVFSTFENAFAPNIVGKKEDYLRVAEAINREFKII